MHGRPWIGTQVFMLVVCCAFSMSDRRASADEAESERVVERLLEITFVSSMLEDLPNRVIAADLGLSGEQCSELNRLSRIHDAAVRASWGAADWKKARQADNEARRGLIATVSTAQLVRAHEIYCRLHGPTLLLTVVADELKTTGAQDVAIKAVVELHFRAKRKASSAAGFDAGISMNPQDMPEYRRRNLELVRTEAQLHLRATARIIELLVPEQRQALERMYGPPFDILRYYEVAERSRWDHGPDEPPERSASLAAPAIVPRR